MADTKTDKELIDAGGWGECWICRDVFRRRRETKRYCNKCHRGWCEGEHGNFAHNIGHCIICGQAKAK